MIKISKAEAQYIRKNGHAEDVHMSSVTYKARGKEYYLTESYPSMKLLKKYKQEHIKYTYDGEYHYPEKRTYQKRRRKQS